MPIEIRELVIRAVVDTEADRRRPDHGDEAERQALIQACVEETLRILRRGEER